MTAVSGSATNICCSFGSKTFPHKKFPLFVSGASSRGDGTITYGEEMAPPYKCNASCKRALPTPFPEF